MTSEERVLAACAFRRPDRIPRCDDLWGASEAYRRALGDLSKLTDVFICYPNEGMFATRSRVIKEEGGWTYSVDEWGRTIRTREGAYFSQVLEVAVPAGTDIAGVEFDSPLLESRYLFGKSTRAEADALVAENQRRYCVFGKTGGPFLRTCYARGEVQFLVDMLTDPPLARALAEKVAEHLTAVGLEEMRRWGFAKTGMWIFDDMACNRGPVFSPESFEQVLLPAYRRMIKAYKDAGARHVILHSDGDIRPILDMLLDAGIEGINPLERRAGMDPVALRKRYPRLVLTGGMDNTDTLVFGPASRIEAETREIIDLGRDGGVVIGTHSISPDVPLENFLVYHETCVAYGDFTR